MICGEVQPTVCNLQNLSGPFDEYIFCSKSLEFQWLLREMAPMALPNSDAYDMAWNYDVRSYFCSRNHVAAIGLLRWVSAIRPLLWILLRSHWGGKNRLHLGDNDGG